LQYSSLAIIPVAYQAGLPSFFHYVNQPINQVSRIVGQQAFTLSVSRAILLSCFLAFPQAGLPAFLNVCRLLFLKYGLPVCLPTFKGKEPIKFIRLYSGGSVWRSEAVFGSRTQCNAIGNRALLCIVIFINGFMQMTLDILGGNGNGNEPFFPVTSNPSRRADFCVQQNTASCVLRHSKPSSCLKTTCPLQGAENTFRSQGFVWI
jgi:hypothetical protein